MSLFNDNAIAGASGQSRASYSISRSLRFNSADSAYLSRTPASAGNRKTWTWAGWVKRSKLGTQQHVFAASTVSPNDQTYIEFNTSDQITLGNANSASVLNFIATSAVYRDTSAWYHIVVAYNTTDATASNRVKLYVNGSQVTQFASATYPALNYDTHVNNTIAHAIGRAGGFSVYYTDAYLADVHLIDGQALDPTSFGEFSATTGVWMPKQFTGSYGSQGWKLDFADNSAATAAALGKDTSGNGNNFTPTNLSVAPTPITESWSGSFDGNNDCLSLSGAGSAIDFTGAYTIECWFRLTSNLTSQFTGSFYVGRLIAGVGNGGVEFSVTSSGSGTTVPSVIVLSTYATGTPAQLSATGLSIPLNTWHHVAVVRNASNVTSIYLNGTRVATATISGSYTSRPVEIAGANAAGLNGWFPGYISNMRVVDGSAVYDPSQTTLTVPPSPLTAITNTSLLVLKSSTFIDNSANNFTITANSNAVVSSLSPFQDAFRINDSFVDVPVNGSQTDTGVGGEVRGNYCTLNPLENGATLSNGNLDASVGTSAANSKTYGNFVVSTGKWYWEIFHVSSASSANTLGVVPGGAYLTTVWSQGVGYYGYDGTKVVSGSQTAYGATYGTGVTIGIALNLDAGTITFYRNGVSQGSITLPSSVTGWKFNCTNGTSDGPQVISCNFGQRFFAYPVSGFKALCTANLPAPTIVKPSTVMDVVTYTGTGSTLTPTSSLGFSPDLVWIKSRSAATDHALYNTVRGAQRRLESNTTDGEVSSDNGLTAFNSAGFTLGTLAQVNTNAATYAAWCWDTGSSTVSNTAGTITSSVRASTTNGCSVLTYTSNGTNGATFGHGLGVAPQFTIIKAYTAGGAAFGWAVYHQALGNTKYLLLESTAAAATSSTVWNNTSPTSTVVTLGTNDLVNSSIGFGLGYVAYCFAPVAGYSAFGSYTGNGSADGPFVYTGFRSRYILVKSSSATSYWLVWDTARDDYNLAFKKLGPSVASAENSNADLGSSSQNTVDILSNGFKLRETNVNTNQNGATYVWAAFAESPFQYSRAR
jgi:hypothetical protein